MCGFWFQNSDFRTRITSLCRWIDPTWGFSMQNSDFWTRITSLCGSQTSPVIFCMQNSVPSITKTSLHGSQPSCVVFGCNTAHFGPEFQVSVGPRTHLWFWAHITPSLTQDNIGSSPHLWLCACKTSTLGLELQVSECQRHHLWFFHAKQCLLDQSNKSLWVPDMTCRFVHVQQRD